MDYIFYALLRKEWRVGTPQARADLMTVGEIQVAMADTHRRQKLSRDATGRV